MKWSPLHRIIGAVSHTAVVEGLQMRQDLFHRVMRIDAENDTGRHKISQVEMLDIEAIETSFHSIVVPLNVFVELNFVIHIPAHVCLDIGRHFLHFYKCSKHPLTLIA